MKTKLELSDVFERATLVVHAERAGVDLDPSDKTKVEAARAIFAGSRRGVEPREVWAVVARMTAGQLAVWGGFIVVADRLRDLMRLEDSAAFSDKKFHVHPIRVLPGGAIEAAVTLEPERPAWADEPRYEVHARVVLDTEAGDRSVVEAVARALASVAKGPDQE